MGPLSLPASSLGLDLTHHDRQVRERLENPSHAATAATKSSTSRSWLFSALAIADCRHLRTSRAMRLRENSRSASAAATFLPRISVATRLSFCGEIRSIRATALASLSPRLRPRARLLMAKSLASDALCLAVGRVAVKRPRRRELAELVADHLFGDQHRNVFLSVVDPERQADELRQYGRTPAPHLDDLVAAGRARRLRLLEQVPVHEGTFPNRTRHGSSSISSSSARGGSK